MSNSGAALGEFGIRTKEVSQGEDLFRGIYICGCVEFEPQR